jgi:type IX secretion system PorP/SprF family membrane protein
MRKYYLCSLVVLLLAGHRGMAQVDPHFSQYYTYPLWLNPALTGAMDGDYRVTGIYRNQWGSIGNPYSTPGVSADVSVGNNLSLGVNVMNQQAGGGGYNYLNAYASMAYTGVRFGPSGNHRISMGISMGILNRRFDPSKFQTGDQWNPNTGFDPTAGGLDVLAKTSGTSFDAGAGILYFDATPDKKANIFAGFSAYHLTQPSDPFISGSTGEKLPIRYTAHGGVKLTLTEDLSITPNLLYMRQGKSEEKMAGFYAQMRINETADFLLGANYRVKDAMSPYVGLYYKNFVLGLSYDVNTSDLGKAAGHANSFELSLTFTGRKGNHADAIPFVCPRL